MFFKSKKIEHAVKKVIKILETAPGSEPGAKMKALNGLKPGLDEKNENSPASGSIMLFNLVSALSGVFALIEAHKIKPDYSVNFSFARLKSSLSALSRKKLPESKAENASAREELRLASRQINSEREDFINTVKFDSIYSELAAVFDLLDGFGEALEKEKK